MIKYQDTSDGTQKVTITYFGNEEPDVVVTDREKGSAIIARWAYMDYQVRSFIDDLIATGESIWEGSAASEGGGK